MDIYNLPRRLRVTEIMCELTDMSSLRAEVKVKSHSSTGPDRPSGFQEVETPRISNQSAYEGGKVVSPTHRQHLPPGNIPGTHFC
jgi:hypothetical protein